MRYVSTACFFVNCSYKRLNSVEYSSYVIKSLLDYKLQCNMANNVCMKGGSKYRPKAEALIW